MLGKTIKLLSILTLIAGCSSPRYEAPVKDHAQPPSTKVKTHTVAEGETLYSIAWRYNLNYRNLAKANNIGASYTIYPGQLIYLSEAHSANSYRRPSQRTETQSRHSRTVSSTEVVENTKSNRSVKRTEEVKKRPSLSSAAQIIRWRWPAKGRILEGFESKSSLHKGIDIDGDLGEPVHAAAAGTVVYSGDGLRGYGNLIIIKHSELFLSAYAHNQRILVAEGDKVKMNDKIAEMGATGTDSVKLHFEIRYKGDPVDPTRYLPKR